MAICAALLLFTLSIPAAASSHVQHTARAAAALTGLHVSGSQLLDGNNNPVRFTGVNRAGTEYACVGPPPTAPWGIFDGPSDLASVQAIASWHANAVRVLLNEDCWLGINQPASAYTGQNYINAIVAYVQLLNQSGLYAELSLIWGAPGTTLATHQPAAPDADHSPAFWTSVANTFKSNPNVVFGVWGETTVSWGCFLNGCSNEAGYTTAGTQSLVNAIRATGATQPIVVPGINYANDLSQWLTYEPKDTLNPAQIMAEAHIYGNNTCGAQNNGACLTSTIAPVAAVVPTFFGETGETFDDSECTSNNMQVILPWADAHNVGYLAWTWDTWGNCDALISDYAGTPNTTTPAGAAYGKYVHDHLASVGGPPPPPPSPPCSSSSLAPSVSSPQSPGGVVTFTATSTGCSTPEYKFFLQTPGGSWTAQTGFGGATWGWNTSGYSSGVYGVGVWARQVGSAASYEAYWIGTYTLSVGTCTAATVTASPASPQAPGSAVTFTASATGCSNPSFEFWALVPGRTTWVVIQGYGAANTFNWTAAQTAGSPQGTYRIGAWARQAGSGSSYDAYGIASFELGSGSCNSAGLAPSLAPPQAPSAMVTFTASSNACTNPLYQFWLLPPGGAWTVTQAYSATTTWAWNTTGLTAGTYQVGVWAKAGASAASYDGYFIGTYQLNVGPCTAAGISPSPASPQAAGTTITFTATATGCSTPSYQFWVLAPSSASWQIVQPYAAASTSAFVPGARGPYRVGVWVRQAGSPTTYDSYAIVTFQAT